MTLRTVTQGQQIPTCCVACALCLYHHLALHVKVYRFTKGLQIACTDYKSALGNKLCVKLYLGVNLSLATRIFMVGGFEKWRGCCYVPIHHRRLYKLHRSIDWF